MREELGRGKTNRGCYGDRRRAETLVVEKGHGRHTAVAHAAEAVSAYRPPDELAHADRPVFARRGALPPLSSDRVRAGIARLPGGPRYLAVRHLSAHHRALQPLGLRLD